MRLASHIVPAADARLFYRDLIQAGARPRPHTTYTLAYLLTAPVGITLVALGFTADGLAASRLWGVGGALLAWPLFFLMRSASWAYAHQVRMDNEGWTPLYDRPEGALHAPTVPRLRVRFRERPFPVVQIGSRTLHLRGMVLARRSGSLVASRGGHEVASLTLLAT